MFLVKLGLEANNIGPDGIIAIAEAISENTTLTELYLSANSMKNEGLIAVAKSLQNKTSLTVLGLEGNLISDTDGFDSLSEMICHCTKLERLFLNKNFIAKQAAVALGKALALTESLRELNLSHNKVCDEGGEALGTLSFPLF